MMHQYHKCSHHSILPSARAAVMIVVGSNSGGSTSSTSIISIDNLRITFIIPAAVVVVGVGACAGAGAGAGGGRERGGGEHLRLDWQQRGLTK